MDRRVGSYLVIAALAGVLSLLLVPLEELAPGISLPPLAVRALSLIQPTVLAVLLVILGNVLAPRVGLDAPLVRAWAAGESGAPVLQRQATLAGAVAVVVAIILIIYSKTVVPRLIELPGSEAFARLVAMGLPLPTKLLYGGITEELLTRWGLMSLLAWIGWRLAGKPENAPAWVFWSAIVVAAALFAAGHLALLFALFSDPPSWGIAAVMIGNTVPGVLFGWLFWRRGIEAAIMAHAAAHLLSTVALLA